MWELVPPMKNYRVNPHTVFYNKKRFSTPCKTVEMYNQRRKQWFSMSSLPSAISAVKSALILNDKILVFGKSYSGNECSVKYSLEQSRQKELNGDVSYSLLHSGDSPAYLSDGIIEISVYNHREGQK